jgi:hypothetical protein
MPFESSDRTGPMGHQTVCKAWPYRLLLMIVSVDYPPNDRGVDDGEACTIHPSFTARGARQWLVETTYN